MGAAPIQLVVRVDAGPGADHVELAELAFRLRDDVEQLDDASVKLAPGEAPEPGAKSADAIEWGTLVVSLVTTGALTAFITTVNDWVSRQRGDVTVKVGDDQLVLTGASSADQRRLIDAWLARQVPVVGRG